LMLLTDARRGARTSAEGELIDLADQDRSLWDADQVDEGVALVTAALGQGPIGPYQVQAAIAAVHDEAASSESTDWPEVLALYELLDRIAPNPMATINRAVALAMVRGPGAGLSLLASLDDDRRVAQHHRLYAVRGHLLEMAGDLGGAHESFENAFRRTASTREKRYLRRRIDKLSL
jgi:predicted RNA polymerase sigma factor